ncbi:MAG: hypothetical protein ACTSQE_04435 [Candidatus Heimdallarchaeaceae archaeon]
MSPEAKIIGNKVLIEDKKSANDFYSNGWYGELTEEGTLELEPHETVLLLERQRIEIQGEKGEHLPLENVVTYFSERIPDFLVHYLLYKDLRGRGYVVKKYEGESHFFTLYERGASPNKEKEKKYALIVPFIEGVMFNIDQIEQIVSQASKVGLKLIFAVIDSLGDVSYYSVKSMDFPTLKKEDEENDL